MSRTTQQINFQPGSIATVVIYNGISYVTNASGIQLPISSNGEPCECELVQHIVEEETNVTVFDDTDENTPASDNAITFMEFEGTADAETEFWGSVPVRPH